MELVSDLLEQEGYRILKAASAEEALRLAANNIPDLILMDISLASMDGLVATRLLRERPATSLVPIVALTAHAMPGDREKAMKAGCNGYITKPIDTRSFLKLVAHYADNQV
jgi:CheY-like chemotaxis protein